MDFLDRIVNWLFQDDDGKTLLAAPWDRLSSDDLRDLPLAYRFRIRITRHFILFAVILLIAGILFSQKGFICFGIALSATIFYSYIQARRSLSALKIGEITAPKTVQESESFQIRFKIQNPSGHSVRNFLVRFLFQGSQKYEAFASPLVIPAHETRLLSLDFLADNGMGEFTLGPIQLIAQDALGLFSICIEQKLEQTIDVLPEEIPLDSFKTFSAALSIHSGSFEVRAPGDAPSFLGLREWRPGDRTRRIDWKRSQLSGNLIVREFERLNAADVSVFFDQEARSHCEYKDASTFEILKDSAISLINCLANQQMNVQFISTSIQIPSGQGSEHSRICGEEIKKMELLQQAPFDELLKTYLVNTPSDSIVILLFTSIQKHLRDLMEFLVIMNERRIDVVLIIADISEFISKIESEIKLDEMDSNILNALKTYIVEGPSGTGLGSTLTERTFILGPDRSLAEVYYG